MWLQSKKNISDLIFKPGLQAFNHLPRRRLTLPRSYHEIKEKTKKREHKVATGEAEDMGSLHPQRTVGRSGSGEHKCPDNLQDAAFCLKQYF